MHPQCKLSKELIPCKNVLQSLPDVIMMLQLSEVSEVLTSVDTSATQLTLKTVSSSHSVDHFVTFFILFN